MPEEFDWENLEARANRVVCEVQDSLPAEIATIAVEVPCYVHQWSDDALGYCEQVVEGELNDCRGPIHLFMGNIMSYCQEEGLSFDDEVRVTYLHELGHILGWSEEDLEARGLG